MSETGREEKERKGKERGKDCRAPTHSSRGTFGRMAATAEAKAAHRVSKESVAKQFVKLYYSILNTHHEYLHQFYGQESAIVVSEMLDGGKTMTESADTHEGVQELLKSLYEEVDVRVDTSVPQFTLEGSVLLLITGVMTRKTFGEERIFTQALLLMPQENGYFIRTDTVHVLGKAQTLPIMEGFESRAHEEPKVLSSLPVDEDVNMNTPRMQLDPCGGMVLATDATPQGDPAYVDMPYVANGFHDIQASTPPAHEVDLHMAGRAKSTDSDEDHNQRSYHSSGLPPPHGGVRSSAARRLPVSSGIPMPANVPMPPMSIPGQYSRLPHHPGHRRDMSMSMSMSMSMNAHMGHAPPPVLPVRRRSLSMGSDPRVVSAPPGHGVFIARLPFGIQPEDVLEAFSLFGPILGEADGIQVRDGRNGCYAFVTFESAASANAAIQKGAVVQGKRVYVEPRYPRQEADPPHTIPVSTPASVPASVPPAATKSAIPAAPRRAA